MISKQSTGVYIAYPTSSELKPTYRGHKSQVNNRHTKVGITVKSFESREREYRVTFGGEVEFIPLVEVPAVKLKELEKVLIMKVREHFQTVGSTKEWFDTDDRETLMAIVKSVFVKND